MLPERPEKPEIVSQATVFDIYSNKAQELALRQWAIASAWFRNKCVEVNQQLYAHEGRFAFHGELSALLPEMRAAESLAWLKEPQGMHLVDVSRRFDKALRDFLDDRQAVRAGRKTAAKAKESPKFKSKLARHLPRELMERLKQGFGAPVDAWLRGPLRAWAEERLGADALAADDLLDTAPIRRLWQQHLSGRHDHGQVLWRVLMLQAWRREMRL